jgi:hypothetical protein
VSTGLRRAIVVIAVAAMLLGALHHAWQRRPSAIREHDWGNVRGDGVLNAVRRVADFDSKRGRFSYYTGARSGDDGPLTAAPTHVLAEAAHESVSVRLIGFDAYQHAQAGEQALQLARIVSAATTNIYPAASIPVEIDLHFMPEGARFSLAKRVDWREGRPFALAVFGREQQPVGTTAAHELYHVLSARWSLRDKPEAIRRPGAASSYEDAAAELYAGCGQLLADGTLQRDQPSMDRVTLSDPVRGEQIFEGALEAEALQSALELMQDGASGRGLRGFGPLLAATVYDNVFGDIPAVTLNSPPAVRLLALCKDAAADPFALETWLAEL